ncbi:hypothetical protein GZH47_01380 [Paenibacillus rhizovicinus]|uniref:DUF4433 domain-containing protein n=1 Tax=Paenibacillus rhizovicinus TaxID=2704463 RepID=A0A6C0NTX2_9BACL|nr:hypothetical protein [Paenibacillus rhizovicinus]QHW29617.1 hypothetical protein GZH47_01380 [Paenibacillus rhizovicinus]
MDNAIAIVTKITNSQKRKSLFHFTRVRNLPSIAHVDALYSSIEADPAFANEGRATRKEIQLHGRSFVANAHLRIAAQAMDPNTTAQQFFQYLDRHVFLWPTRRSCLKMLEMYARREPGEAFAVLQLDARSLLLDFYDRIKLSKYDSGSSPRFPGRTTYKKSLAMFLPLERFETVQQFQVPSKPSEILEVLVENKVTHLSRYLQAVYCEQVADIPGDWREFGLPLQQFMEQ